MATRWTRSSGDQHWLCTRSAPAYAQLLFVPMLTPDIPASTEGRTPHERFDCRPEIRDFLVGLSAKRSLNTVRGLGSIDPERRFEVVIWPPKDRYVAVGANRACYWAGWSLDGLPNTLAFIDPDTGFETKTQKEERWVRHSEVERVPCIGRVEQRDRLPAPTALRAMGQRVRQATPTAWICDVRRGSFRRERGIRDIGSHGRRRDTS